MKVKEESEKAGLKLNIQKTKIMASSPIASWQIDGGKKWKQWQTLFSWAPKSLQPQNSNLLASWQKSYNKTKQHIKKKRHHFANESL